MPQCICRITVLFEDPFWVGILEREEDGALSVCKVTFGAEPKDYEVHAFLLANWRSLRFGAAMRVDSAVQRRIAPKRMQREIKRSLQGGTGTKAQQALAAAREQNKKERQVQSRAQKLAEQQARFEQHQKKRKEKHKGH